MKFEFSAGGVIYRRGEEEPEVLVAQHSFHHGWVFPKGLIGDKEHLKGEDKMKTAIREVKEETGAEGKIIQELTPVTYWYQMSREAGSRSAGDNVKRKKTVYYFLMEYTGGDITQHDHEMEAVEWLPLDEVEARLTYKSDKEVFKEAKPIIERLVKTM